MKFTTLMDDLLVNGVSINSMPGIIPVDYAMYAPSNRRGSADTIPFRQGQLPASMRPLDSFTFNVEVSVIPEDNTGMPENESEQRALMLDNLRYLNGALSSLGGLTVLTRRLTTGSGTYVDHQALGEYVQGSAIAHLLPMVGQTTLEFINHDGAWYDLNYTEAAPGTVNVAGDFPTRKLLLDLPGPGTLTNESLGVWVSVTTDTVLDVDDYSASHGLSTLQHGGSYVWFELRTGLNDITWSGAGTPTIRYKSMWV